MARTPIATALLGAALVAAPESSAQTPLTTERIISGVSSPVWVGTCGRPGDNRIFVVEQNQADIEIFTDGVKNNVPYLNLDSITTVTTGGERGLLGVAFHPDYEENAYVFINYTGAGGATFIDRFTAYAPDANRVDASSRVQVMSFNQPYTNHNGGWIGFGPDGMLYVATGDGGSANDPQCNAQNPNSPLGKLLRVDVDSIDSTGSYSVPADNPFVGVPGVLPEIFHFGLRNPWRCSFDPVTGDLYMGDVGQNLREEVSISPLGSSGGNYGWRIQEGELCNGLGACTAAPGCGSASYLPPVHTYSHGGGNCSITGGIVYRGCAIPDLSGTYFFSDYCSGKIWSFELVGGVTTAFTDRTAELDPAGPLGIGGVTAFGTDHEGEMLIADYFGGEVFRLIPASGAAAGCDTLRSDWNAISAQFGGAQELELHMGAGNAGALYVVLGSASGTSSGLSLNGVTIPLVFDSYLSFTLGALNQPPFQQNFGVLDAEGMAEAEIQVPAGVLGGAQVGLTLHHAAVVLDGTGSPVAATNAVPLTFAP
jgi:glucose/arabinose dehydrogenase